MKDNPFYKQAELLLRVLPIVNMEEVFALKGGTAINFFIRNMPRLSVDIDLTYLPINEREKSLKEIASSLLNIENNILKLIPNSKVQKKYLRKDLFTGLIVSTENAIIKIEPNSTIRGTVLPTQDFLLCNKAEELFEISFKTRAVCFEELYAGKICAALDRQNPRDLFDIKLLFDNEGLTEKIRKVFIVYLISHNRPINELLEPHLLDISDTYEKEFKGMTEIDISLDELCETRNELIKKIKIELTNEEKQFLVSVKQLKPEWRKLGLNNIDNLPAVKWKLVNLEKMDKAKRNEAVNKLESLFEK